MSVSASAMAAVRMLSARLFALPLFLRARIHHLLVPCCATLSRIPLGVLLACAYTSIDVATNG
jgi:hypothetical protein